MLRDQVANEVGGALAKLGFRRKGDTWRREVDTGIEVFNLQASRRSPVTFYVNVGVYIGDAPEPTEAHCYPPYRQRIKHEGLTSTQIFDEVQRWFEAQAARLGEDARAPAVEPVRVTHPKFGAGTIVSDRGTTVEVAFDDGTLRRIAKSYIAP